MGFAFSNDLTLESAAFAAEGAIPSKYTGEGEDVSPALSWKNAPAGTKSFAVICHDPDAPLISANGTYGFVHWVYYNIPSDVTELPEGCNAYTQGKNNFGKPGYNGPMPPEGHGQHKYYFWIIALDAEPNLPADLSLWKLLEKIEPNATAMNRLIGTYQRG
ncbi:MAG: YbhB/YbcL family Raf kinase inhibitor-like protein [Halopseudomonas sp.]|uniref:YbhB/YbcL family Raf kinase inhibitor-like protein n=1 Tax=Halopseudomonas sp. TaxID=2901191 RepID=UPI00300169D2